jgi:hypothetical protein
MLPGLHNLGLARFRALPKQRIPFLSELFHCLSAMALIGDVDILLEILLQTEDMSVNVTNNIVTFSSRDLSVTVPVHKLNRHSWFYAFDFLLS